MDVLSQRGIPFRNEQEVQDLSAEPLFGLILDFLLVILGETEPDAWESLQRVLDNGVAEGTSNSRGWDRLLREARSDLRSDPTFQTAWNWIEELLKRLGTEAIRALSHDYESDARRNEILGGVNAHIKSSFEGDADPLEALKSIGGIDAVRILTIHKCKGLEFHTVIVQGVEPQTFWGEKEATECAFFVAISRARKRLVVTTADFREKLPGANHHWRQQRSRHEQFLGYVESEVGGSL
jgi:superfamily I DNA/RNA helicase